MDDQEVPRFIPARDDTDMAIFGIKHKIAGEGIGPCDRCANGVLGGRAAVAKDEGWGWENFEGLD